MVQSIGNSGHGGHHAEVRQRRPDTARLVDNVFTKLDTKNQGFLEKADLQAALSRIPGAAGNATTDDAVFQRLDSDADGKVTKAELTSTLQTAADQLAGQFDGLRLHGRHGHHGHGHGRGRGHGHDGEDATAGFTKDQLSAQLEGLGGSHGGRARMLGAVIDNFAQADANADGQVNFREIVGFFRGDRDDDAAPVTTPVTTPAPVDPTPAEPVAAVPPAAQAGTVSDAVAAATDPVTELATTAPAPASTTTVASTAPADATPATAPSDPLATVAATAAPATPVLDPTAPADAAPATVAIDPVTSVAAAAPAAAPVLTSTAATDATPATPGATPPADTAAAERAVLQRILQLVRAYGAPGQAPGAAAISASA